MICCSEPGLTEALYVLYIHTYIHLITCRPATYQRLFKANIDDFILYVYVVFVVITSEYSINRLADQNPRLLFTDTRYNMDIGSNES
jgi:hypothetical protein